MQFARFNMAPRMVSSPFFRSRVRSYYNITKDGTFSASKFVLYVRRKFFSQDRLPARFSDDIVRVKRGVFRRTVDGAPFEVKASSGDQVVASSFGLIAIFLHHSPDLQLFQEETERLRDFLN